MWAVKKRVRISLSQSSLTGRVMWSQSEAALSAPAQSLKWHCTQCVFLLGMEKKFTLSLMIMTSLSKHIAWGSTLEAVFHNAPKLVLGCFQLKCNLNLIFKIYFSFNFFKTTLKFSNWLKFFKLGWKFQTSQIFSFNSNKHLFGMVKFDGWLLIGINNWFEIFKPSLKNSNQFQKFKPKKF